LASQSILLQGDRMRKYDIDIDRRAIQQLSGTDEIAAFFARLGYSTDARIEQTADNLGITAEGAKRPIKHIWLIADEEVLLQVYLFELKSVTMTNIRELARAFRNKAGNYLFVLTSEYDRLDFVLIERIAPIGASDRIATKQSGVRPRVLTVDRTDPGSVALRVLRRFTYTESDPVYQYEKLLSAYSIADWSEEYFNNRALFSDYFLMNRLQVRPEWNEDPKPAYKRLKEIYKESLSKYLSEQEVEVRHELYEPTFKELGFKYETGKVATDPAYERPDYYLYSPHHKPKQDKPIAVALVYPWGRSLDGKDDRRDKDTPEENPGTAVVSLLEADKAPWAIVTNGQIWRLYSQKTHSRATNYYEIDLTEALSLGSPAHIDPAQAFLYYWLFFRHEAFEENKVVHEGKEVEQSFLDQMLIGSEEYAKELGKRLKERIFERIFPHLAEGFIADILAKEGKDAMLPQERLDQVFQGTLTLLYRLLFLLYAESRDLLPAKEVRGYYEASIKKLKEEIAEAAGTIDDEAPAKIARRYRADEFEIYKRLSRLFEVIDRGEEKLNVPVYNGGLFVTDPANGDDSSEAASARFLRDYGVPNRYLAQAIDLLARDIDDKRQDLVFIDYKSLGVRQLGSMYEGLLEFRLRVAPERMAIVKGKKTEEIIPYKEAKSKKRRILTEGRGKNVKDRTLSKRTVYLENDKRERKATGSYYTPGHIVKYIIENAVGPVLKTKLEVLRPKLRVVEQKRRAFDDRQKALRHSGLKPEPEEKKKLIGLELIDEVFNIRVLDPAMGSGHFLVQAVDFITDKILHFLNSFPVNPVRDFLEKTRETILREMEDQGITIDTGRLTDVNLLKRYVLKRCIYGVDFNPMAVELAKVSLWLDCFTLGAPLSFLDHHLRCGNSLIGVTVKEVREAIETQKWETFSLFGSRFTGLMLATNLMREVGELSDVTSKDVSESRRKYKKATDALASFKRILDVYTSRWFGNEPYTLGRGRKRTEHDPAKEFLQSQEVEGWLKDPEGAKLSDWGRKISETAARAAAEKRFFHWELEFPEVFYGQRPGTERVIERLEGAGFDAVVGNPPYGFHQIHEKQVKLFFKFKYSAAQGSFEHYFLFLEKPLELLSLRGKEGLIVPVTWLTIPSARSLRKKILNDFQVDRIYWIDDLVFEDAEVNTLISTIQKERGNNVKVFLGSSNEVGRSYKEYRNYNQEDFIRIDYYIGIFITPEDMKLIDKIQSMSVPLVKFATPCSGYNPYEVGKGIAPEGGPHTKETVETKPYHSEKRLNKEWKQEIGGKDLSRYSITMPNDRWVKYGPWLAAPRDRNNFLDKRILVREITGGSDKRIVAAYYENELYYSRDVIPIKIIEDDTHPYFLLGIINSKLIAWYHLKRNPKAQKGLFPKILVSDIEKLPIKDIDLSDRKQKDLYVKIVEAVDRMIDLCEKEKRLRNRGQRERFEKDINILDAEIDRLVFRIYELSRIEIEVVDKTML